MEHNFEPAVRTAEDDEVSTATPEPTEIQKPQLRMCKNTTCHNEHCIFIHTQSNFEELMANRNLPWLHRVQSTAIRTLAKCSHLEREMHAKDMVINQLKWDLNQLRLQQQQQQQQQQWLQPNPNSQRWNRPPPTSATRGHSTGAVRRAPSAGRM